MSLDTSSILSALTIVCILFIIVYTSIKIRIEKRLRDHGQKADAVILSIDDTQHKYLLLNLRIEPSNHPAFEAQQRVDRLAHDPFHVGDRIGVLFDPQSPTSFTLEYPFGEDKR